MKDRNSMTEAEQLRDSAQHVRDSGFPKQAAMLERYAEVMADAERWRKLIGIARMRVIGSAGTPMHHVGIDFWHDHPEPSRDDTLQAFTDFVDRIPEVYACPACRRNVLRKTEAGHAPSCEYEPPHKRTQRTLETDLKEDR